MNKNIHFASDHSYSEIILDFDNNIIPTNDEIEEFFKISHCLYVCLANDNNTPLHNKNDEEFKRICDFIHSMGRYIECKTKELIYDSNIDCWNIVSEKVSNDVITFVKNIPDYLHTVKFEVPKELCKTYNLFKMNFLPMKAFYENLGYEILVENEYPQKKTIIEFLDKYREYNYNYFMLNNHEITTRLDLENKKKEEI